MTEASGGWETWTWDESLFAGAARYYEQGRLPYAPGLAETFARGLGLDGPGRLLDVGCGPGTVTLLLAPLFEAAVGLDPDPDMLAHAVRAATRRGISNVTWARQRAEDLPAGLGTFRAVTFASSFHWMDRPLVAATVATMLEAGGAVVQIDAPARHPGEPGAQTRLESLPFPPPPQEALDQLRRDYLGADRRAGQIIRNTSPDGEDQVFRAAGFLPAQTLMAPDQRVIERTADDVVAYMFSLSSTAPHLFGDRQQAFEADMRAILARASPAGRFSVRLPDNRLRIWRRPALPGGPRPGRRHGRSRPLARRTRRASTVRKPRQSASAAWLHDGQLNIQPPSSRWAPARWSRCASMVRSSNSRRAIDPGRGAKSSGVWTSPAPAGSRATTRGSSSSGRTFSRATAARSRSGTWSRKRHTPSSG
ncbi:MAG TPA: class I SAM-dependent methyltransferase [Trebonia sp.]|nr:class I SAM-dependent methyltransferase [Trebonia sp.]